VPAQPPEQIGSDGMVWVVVVQIQLVHRRGSDGEQLVAQGDDLGPVGLRDGPSIRMHSVDGRLELIGTELVAAKAQPDDRLAFLNQGPVPAGAVLLTEQHQGTVGPGSRRATGFGEQQQGEQVGHLWLVGQKRGQDPRQPDRLGASDIGCGGTAGPRRSSDLSDRAVAPDSDR
jgi:hypothetical protein